MVSFTAFQKIALGFPGTTEEPHFEKTSFRVKKKIFATYDAKNKRACVKLSLTDQDLFSVADKSIYPLANKWGQQGWTIIEMKTISKALFTAALTMAYCEVAPAKLADQVRPKESE